MTCNRCQRSNLGLVQQPNAIIEEDWNQYSDEEAHYGFSGLGLYGGHAQGTVVVTEEPWRNYEETFNLGGLDAVAQYPDTYGFLKFLDNINSELTWRCYYAPGSATCGTLLADSFYNPDRVKSAIKNFQQKYGIVPVDGILGPKTMAAILGRFRNFIADENDAYEAASALQSQGIFPNNAIPADSGMLRSEADAKWKQQTSQPSASQPSVPATTQQPAASAASNLPTAPAAPSQFMAKVKDAFKKHPWLRVAAPVGGAVVILGILGVALLLTGEKK